MNTYPIDIFTALLWVLIYLIVCGLIPGLLDKIVWRTIKAKISSWLNLITLLALNAAFLLTLIRKNRVVISLFSNISIIGILLAIGCSLLFFVVLDKLLDPFFDKIFTVSADEYRKELASLSQYPLVNFIRICLLAPVVEEIFIRACILSALQIKYGLAIALILSSLLFAILHFNFVQTLSALVCGLVLGLLFVYTGSLLSCILAHLLYNTISYINMTKQWR